MSLLKWLATALFAPIPSEFRYNRFRICYTELTLLRSEIFDNRYAVLSNAPFLRCEFPNRNRL
nr:hypothetical protein [Leptospira santarosai]